MAELVRAIIPIVSTASKDDSSPLEWKYIHRDNEIQITFTPFEDKTQCISTNTSRT